MSAGEQPAYQPEDYEATPVSYIDALQQHLAGRDISLAEFRGRSALGTLEALDVVTTLDDFVRVQTRLRDESTPLLPSGMIRVTAADYLKDIAAAPKHQAQLVRAWAPIALRHADVYGQVIDTAGLFHELRKAGDPLQKSAADLLAIQGKTIFKLPGMATRTKPAVQDWRKQYGF